MPQAVATDNLWFGLDEHGKEFLFTHKLLRQFMQIGWPGKVPYQLRHFFAQCAVNANPIYGIQDQDVDRLMGHSAFGEHLGSDNIFAPTQHRLIKYLNHLPRRLGLEERQYGV